MCRIPQTDGKEISGILHELLEQYISAKCWNSILNDIHMAHKDQILKNLIEFEYADNDADPNCLRGKYWDLIKLSIL